MPTHRVWVGSGVALIAVTTLWIMLAFLLRGGDLEPVLGLLLICSTTFAGSRLLGRREPTLIPVGVVAFTLVVGFVHRDELYSAVALSGPLGYANAKAALYAQAALAAALLTAVAKHWSVRAIGIAIALAFAAVPFAAQSWAAATLLVASLLATAVGRLYSHRVAVAGLALMFLGALLVTVALGAATRAGSEVAPAGGFIDTTLSQRRIQMWSDAYSIMINQPLVGVGPSRFEEFGPTALDDPVDSRWAHHEFLEFGADVGVTGFVLLSALFMWAFAGMYRHPGPGMATTIGAASLATLGVHACLDYIAHFPEVAVAACAVVGTAGALTRPKREAS